FLISWNLRPLFVFHIQCLSRHDFPPVEMVAPSGASRGCGWMTAMVNVLRCRLLLVFVAIPDAADRSCNFAGRSIGAVDAQPLVFGIDDRLFVIRGIDAASRPVMDLG